MSQSPDASPALTDPVVGLAAPGPDSRGAVSASRRWRARAAQIAFPLVALIVVVVLWQVAVIVFKPAAYLLPEPTQIISAFGRNWPKLSGNIWPTVSEIALGFLLSIVVAIPLAVLIVEFRFFERTVFPLLVVSQTVPKVALAPLFVVWFGFGSAPKILIAFLVAFFPIVIDTAVGLRAVPEEMIDLARSTGASRFATFRRIRFPHSLPNIFGGLKVAVTLAVIGAVVGEFLGADKGLGYLLVYANGQLDTTLLFTDIIALSIIGMIAYVVVHALERVAIPWHVSNRRGG